MKTQIDIPYEEIANFCRRWRVNELALFGSILREDFKPRSDVDILVEFSEGTRIGLFDLARMKEELETLLGRQVGLVSRKGIE